jgi:hypothetical protein
MKKILIVVFFSFYQNIWSQNIVFEWNKIIGKTGTNEGNCIKVDSSGYIYASGYFTDSIDFLGTHLKSKGKLDAYLAKLDSNSNLIWLKQYSGIYDDKITSLQIDKDNYIYICGSYRVKILFDTLLTTNNKDTLYSSNMFLAKYNSNGKLIWTINTGGVEFAGNKINIDDEKNIIITGKSIDIIKFDTTIQVQTLDSVKEYLPHNYGGYYWRYFHPTYNFIAKYNPEGQKVWIKTIGGNPYALKTDNKNNIIVSGNMECIKISGFPCGYFNFDSITLSSIGSETIFLVKYDKNGKLLWAHSCGGGANWNTGYDLAIDSINNIYLAGQIFSGDVKFGNSISFNTVGENKDAFIAKCDTSGDFKWVKIIGTPKTNGAGSPNYGQEGNFNSSNSIIIFNNNILITGYFLDTINLNGSVISSNGQYDMFLARFDMDGNAIKAGAYVSYAWVSGQEISIDKYKNIYVTGYTYLDALDSPYPSYIYIAKVLYDIPTIYIPPYIPPSDNISDIKNVGDIVFYPNPCKNYFIISSNYISDKVVQIMSISGAMVLSVRLKENIKEINMSSFQNGIYIVKIYDDQKLIVRKVIKE